MTKGPLAKDDALKAELQDAEDRANAFAAKEMHTATERDALQAKLDEAVKKLESIEYDVTDGGCECSVCDIFRATLAKLKGETDE